MNEKLEALREAIREILIEANMAEAIGAHGMAARLRRSCESLREAIEEIYSEVGS